MDRFGRIRSNGSGLDRSNGSGPLGPETVLGSGPWTAPARAPLTSPQGQTTSSLGRPVQATLERKQITADRCRQQVGKKAVQLYLWVDLCRSDSSLGRPAQASTGRMGVLDVIRESEGCDCLHGFQLCQSLPPHLLKTHPKTSPHTPQKHPPKARI